MIQPRRLIASAAIALFAASMLFARQAGAVRVAEADQARKLTKKVDPVYPESARGLTMRGPVILEVVADEKGEVVEVRIVKGGHPVVQKPVADAVKQWRYSPTYEGGKAVPVKFRVTVPVVFK
jgi:TonB family protein